MPNPSTVAREEEDPLAEDLRILAEYEAAKAVYLDTWTSQSGMAATEAATAMDQRAAERFPAVVRELAQKRDSLKAAAALVKCQGEDIDRCRAEIARLNAALAGARAEGARRAWEKAEPVMARLAGAVYMEENFFPAKSDHLAGLSGP